jgi:predicted nucleotide-binding protein
MAFDDLTPSQRDPLIALIETLATGDYHDEFVMSRRVMERRGDIHIYGKGGAKDRQLEGFTDSDTQVLIEEGYLSRLGLKATLKAKAYQQYKLLKEPSDLSENIPVSVDVHLRRLLKVYHAAGGSQSKGVVLTEVFKDEALSEPDTWKEADYMEGEGWIAVLANNGPPYVRLTHQGVKRAEAVLIMDKGDEDKRTGAKPVEARTTMTNAADSRNVFVVHGRNLEARNSLFRFLRSIGLRPIEWSQAIQLTGKASPFIGEILDVAFSNAQAVVVLMTPDDLAQLQEPFRSPNDPPYEAQLIGQARPNVLFEAGMAMGRNPDRTIIVELGALRPFSDIAGRHTIRLSNDSTARHELGQRLQNAGCAVDFSGRDWHTEGDFNLSSITSSTSNAFGRVGSEQASSLNVDYINQALKAGAIYPIAEDLLRHIRQLQTVIKQLGHEDGIDPSLSEEINHLQGQINGLYKLSAGDIASHMYLKEAQDVLLDLRGTPSPTEAPVAGDKKSGEDDDSEFSLALEAAREVKITNRQRQWRTSDEGVSSARQEMNALYASLERRVKKASEGLAADEAPINIDLSRENNDHFILSSEPYNISFMWDCKSDTTLEGSVLSIRGYKKGLNEEQFYAAEYDIELSRDLVVGWRQRQQRDRFISTDSLAKEFFRFLVTHIRNKAIYNE